MAMSLELCTELHSVNFPMSDASTLAAELNIHRHKRIDSVLQVCRPFSETQHPTLLVSCISALLCIAIFLLVAQKHGLVLYNPAHHAVKCCLHYLIVTLI
jgi:hypothetical protein